MTAVDMRSRCETVRKRGRANRENRTGSSVVSRTKAVSRVFPISSTMLRVRRLLARARPVFGPISEDEYA